MTNPKMIEISDDEVGSSEDGPFRSYRLDARGDGLWSLLEDAQITEVDQDGGDVCSEGLYEYNSSVVERSELSVAIAFLKSRGFRVTREVKETAAPGACL